MYNGGGNDGKKSKQTSSEVLVDPAYLKQKQEQEKTLKPQRSAAGWAGTTSTSGSKTNPADLVDPRSVNSHIEQAALTDQQKQSQEQSVVPAQAMTSNNPNNRDSANSADVQAQNISHIFTAKKNEITTLQNQIISGLIKNEIDTIEKAIDELRQLFGGDLKQQAAGLAQSLHTLRIYGTTKNNTLLEYIFSVQPFPVKDERQANYQLNIFDYLIKNMGSHLIDGSENNDPLLQAYRSKNIELIKFLLPHYIQLAANKDATIAQAASIRIGAVRKHAGLLTIFKSINIDEEIAKAKEEAEETEKRELEEWQHRNEPPSQYDVANFFIFRNSTSFFGFGRETPPPDYKAARKKLAEEEAQENKNGNVYQYDLQGDPQDDDEEPKDQPKPPVVYRACAASAKMEEEPTIAQRIDALTRKQKMGYSAVLGMGASLLCIGLILLIAYPKFHIPVGYGNLDYHRDGGLHDGIQGMVASIWQLLGEGDRVGTSKHMSVSSTAGGLSIFSVVLTIGSALLGAATGARVHAAAKNNTPNNNH